MSAEDCRKEDSIDTQLNSALRHRRKVFRRRGMSVAIISGMSYGLYTAFISLGMDSAIWRGFNTEQGVLSSYAILILLGILAGALNDLFSALWSIVNLLIKGKFKDLWPTICSKPGRIMLGVSLIGGPIAGAAYIIAVQQAGSIAIPLSALCPAIGAILGRVIYKQTLKPHMMVGIFICVTASILINMTGGLSVPEGASLTLATVLALIAAFGWGLEGCVGGWAACMIDYEISITIRQLTSGLTNLLIVLPVFSLLDRDNNMPTRGLGTFAYLLRAVFSSPANYIFFVISGFFALYAFSLWYKGNSMCGAALGMACNGTYAFWGPIFCWLILGIFGGRDGWSLHPISWLLAVLMFGGIMLIALSPSELRAQEGKDA